MIVLIYDKGLMGKKGEKKIIQVWNLANPLSVMSPVWLAGEVFCFLLLSVLVMKEKVNNCDFKHR